MSIDQTTPPSQESIQADLVGYLSSTLKNAVAPDQDLFADGLVSSLSAMEMVTHLERTYQIEITGSDLRLDHFRTVDAMAALVARLAPAGQ